MTSIFRAEWVLAESPELLAVDKPPLVAELPRDGRTDDLLSRARTVYGATLTTVPQLERTASGIVVFARTGDAMKELNAALATAKRTYLAAVRGAPRDGRLTARIVHRGKQTRVAKDGERAVLDVRVVRRVRDRALVELRVIEGRPAQLRAQLDHAGTPIAEEHRSFVQLSAIDLGALGAFAAPPDPELAAWVERSTPVELLIERAADRRATLASTETDSFRLVHGSGDGLPGIEVDRFGDHAVVHVHTGRTAVAEDAVLDAVEKLGVRGVYVKRHPRTQQKVANVEELAPREPVRGAPAPSVAREHGVEYEVALGDGLSVGLFLDQRDNRGRVRAWSKDRSVLNLFAYTGAFSVAAASGGAKRTVTVDASGPALARARAQLARFGSEHEIVRADVFEYLESARERFDLVIVDPPTFSTTKTSRWSSKAGWERLLTLCLAVATERVLVTSNDRGMTPDDLERHAREAAKRAGKRIDLTRHDPPLDFPPLVETGAHLKTLVLTLRR
jgi:23S rRNA (cytosine1962-C5)-methyltransferase